MPGRSTVAPRQARRCLTETKRGQGHRLARFRTFRTPGNAQREIAARIRAFRINQPARHQGGTYIWRVFELSERKPISTYTESRETCRSGMLQHANATKVRPLADALRRSAAIRRERQPRTRLPSLGPTPSRRPPSCRHANRGRGCVQASDCFSTARPEAERRLARTGDGGAFGVNGSRGAPSEDEEDAGRTGDGGVFGMGRRLRGIRRRATRTGDGGAFGLAIAFPEHPSRTHLRPLFACPLFAPAGRNHTASTKGLPLTSAMPRSTP